MTIDSRDRFKKGPHAKDWNQATASETYSAAIEAALLTMIASQPSDSAAANYYRLEGARTFIGILTNLTTEKPDLPPLTQNLRTNV
jgi:hypothetical protein